MILIVLSGAPANLRLALSFLSVTITKNKRNIINKQACIMFLLFFVAPLFLSKTSNVLLSQGTAPQVPSALKSLTSVFGMGTGVSFSLLPLDYVGKITFMTLPNFFWIIRPKLHMDNIVVKTSTY